MWRENTSSQNKRRLATPKSFSEEPPNLQKRGERRQDEHDAILYGKTLSATCEQIINSPEKSAKPIDKTIGVEYDMPC